MRALGLFTLSMGLLFAPRVQAQGAASRPRSLPSSLPDSTTPAGVDPSAVPAPAPKAKKKRAQPFHAEASVGLGLYFEELEVRDPASSTSPLDYETGAVPSVLVRFGVGWTHETRSHRRLGLVAGLCYRRSIDANVALPPNPQDEPSIDVVHDQIHARAALRWQPFVGLPLELDHGLSLAFRRMSKEEVKGDADEEPLEVLADHGIVFWGLDPLRVSWPLLTQHHSWRVALEGGVSLVLVGSVGELESNTAPGFGTASGWGFGADGQLTVGYGALMGSLGYRFDALDLEFDGCGVEGSCLVGSEGEQRSHMVWLAVGLVVDR